MTEYAAPSKTDAQALLAELKAAAEPECWVSQRALDDLHREGSHVGTKTVIWNCAQSRNSKMRVPLYSAAYVEAQQERIAELERGLAPFSEAARVLDEDTKREHQCGDDYRVGEALWPPQQPTVGDLRRARKLIGEKP